MRVGIVYDSIMETHVADDDHPEKPERIKSIYNALKDNNLLEKLIEIPSKEITKSELELAHCSQYINKIILNLSRHESNIYFQSSDMYANKNTLKAAMIAAGSTLNLVKEILSDNLDSGFAIVRPPGHHATTGDCGGFCFFNNIGISAIYTAKTGKRVMIVDIDVHHGNGTQKIVRKNSELRNILFYSIHRYDDGNFYPGTGKSCDTERVVNIGFNGSKGDSWYLDIFDNKLIPRAKKFAPDLILVSCGFDAGIGDTIGQCNVTPLGYYKMIDKLKKVCPKIALVLEGGYNLQTISDSTVSCINCLLNFKLI